MNNDINDEKITENMAGVKGKFLDVLDGSAKR